METIEKYDMLQPVLVIPKDGSYELVSGHRRLEAMKARNEATIPCIVRNDISEKNVPFIKLIENVQRKQLSAHELVQIFEEMKKNSPGLTQYQIARMVGKSATWVTLKYQAGRIYAELIEKGMTEEAIDELTEADLLKLTRRVKNKKERTESAKSQNRRSHAKHELEVCGFHTLYSGQHNLLVVCRDDQVRNEIAMLLFKHGRKKSASRNGEEIAGGEH